MPTLLEKALAVPGMRRAAQEPFVTLPKNRGRVTISIELFANAVYGDIRRRFSEYPLVVRLELHALDHLAQQGVVPSGAVG